MSKQNKAYSVSQNFLTSRPLLLRITALSSICKTDTVLEIGTGKGHLADVLARRCGTLYTTEIDQALYLQAQRRLAGLPNVHLRYGDFLQSALPERAPYKVFANLPFCITTQILAKLTQAANPPSDMWLVMENGATKRYLGRLRETRQSLLLKPRWDMRIVYYFQREDFHPCPSVNTVLIHFARKPQPDVSPSQWKQYEHFITHALQHGLGGKNRLLTNKQISKALRQAGTPPHDRNSLLLYVQWLCLFRCWVSANGPTRKCR